MEVSIETSMVKQETSKLKPIESICLWMNNILFKNINDFAFFDKFLFFKYKTLTIFNNDSFPNVKHVFIKFNVKNMLAGDPSHDKFYQGVNWFFSQYLQFFFHAGHLFFLKQ